MNNIIQADLYRYNGLSGTKGFIKGWFIPGFRYMFFCRRLKTIKKYSPRWFIYMLLLRRYSYKYGFQIPPEASIGSGFYIGHHGHIIVNPNAVIGKNCNIAPGVTVGQTNRGERKGYPTIGDFVWIGAGAVVVGKVSIGNNVLVAPNAFVNIDVPSGSIVLGNPCRIIPKDNPVTDYIENVLK
ncbi:MAG TPA: serine acetyltransferase [Arachidicoccus sp.]|nr:serine acetyltransferase [Arachidicoccus sp.]